MHGRKIKNNAKFSGHYVRPRTHNVPAHALHLHQHNQYATHVDMYLFKVKQIEPYLDSDCPGRV